MFVLVACVVLMIAGIRLRLFIPLYFAIALFEPILSLPISNSSYFRIYQVLFFLFIIVSFVKPAVSDSYKNEDVHKALRISYISMFAFLMFSLLYVTSVINFLSYLVNFPISGYIIYRISRSAKNSEIILSVFIIYAVFSGIYGLVHDRYLVFEYGRRYFGTYADPNYSALFYTIGIIACLGKTCIPKPLTYIAASFLGLLLLMSNSLTSYIIIVVLLFIYTVFHKPRLALVTVIAAVSLVAILYFMN